MKEKNHKRMKPGKRLVAFCLSMCLIGEVLPLPTYASATDTIQLSESKTTNATTNANANEFTFQNHSAIDRYDAQYRYGNEWIASYTCSGNVNGYGGNKIANVFDDNYRTYWETTQENSATRKNFITVTFKEALEIGNIVYAMRQDTTKGFPTKLNIYGSTKDDGDMTLIAKASHAITQNAVIFSFPFKSFKRITLEWEENDNGKNGWASASELRFYKEDSLQEELKDLFSDEQFSQLSSQASKQRVDELKEEVIAHPFADAFWKYIEAAYLLLGEKVPELVSTIGIEHDFLKDYSNEELAAYDSLYLADQNHTAVVTDANGKMVTEAYDGDWSNYWIAQKSNSSTFKNSLTFQFKEKQNIGRILYQSRSNGEGYPTKFRIFASDRDVGEDFTLVAQGSSAIYKSKTSFTFKEHSFKRLRIVWEETNTNRPTASEFLFYREDTLFSEVKKLFTDTACSSLANGVTMVTIKQMIDKIETHPLPRLMKPYMDVAALLYNGQEETDRIHKTMTLSQRGDRGREHSRTKTSMTLAQYDLTGYYAMPGETIGVFANFDSKGPAPRFVLATANQDPWKWQYDYDGIALSNGYNEIKVPETMKGCQAIYFYNPAIPSDQEFAPVIRLVGGTQYPVYRYNSIDPDASESSDAFLERLSAYVEEVTDIDAMAESGKGKYNICELTSDKVIVTISAKGALKGLKQKRTWDKGQGNGQVYSGAKDTMMLYDQMYDDMMLYSGFNITDPTKEDYKPYNQFLLRAYTNGVGLGWGQSVYAGFNTGNLDDEHEWDGGFYSSLATVGTVLDAGWAIFHEVGHVFDNGIIGQSESTNNLYGLMAQLKYTGDNRLDNTGENRWYRHFTNYINTGILPSDDLLFYPGAVIYQLDAVDFSETTLYKDDGISNYGRGCRYARLNNEQLRGLSYTDKLVISMSMGAGVDLSSHFEYYGRKISEETRWMLSALPKYNKPTWYVNDRTFRGKGFDDTQKSKVPVIEEMIQNQETGAVTLHMNQSTYTDLTGSDKNLQTFEIYRRDITNPDSVNTESPKLLGITGDNKATKNVNELYQFTDYDVTPGKIYEYSVKAYDCELDASNYSEVKTTTIYEDIQVPITVLRLNTGDEGYTSKVGFKFKIRANFSPNNTTVDLNTIQWENNSPINGAGTESIRIEADPDYPNDPTRKVVIGVKQGSTRIKVSLGGLSQSFRFVVNNGDIKLEGLAFENTETVLKVGDKKELIIQKNPSYTTDTQLPIYTSDNEAVVRVVNNEIQAITSGSATITAKVGDIQTQMTVQVVPQDIPITDLEIVTWGTEQEHTTMVVGDCKKASITTTPVVSNQKQQLTWSVESQEPDMEGQEVIVINQNGEITALHQGSATIKATIGAVTKLRRIDVKEKLPVKIVSLNHTKHTFHGIQDELQLTLTPSPKEATGKEDVRYKSANETIATVDENGIVRPVTAGKTTITGFWNGKYDTCEITVDFGVPLTGVKFRGKQENENITIDVKEGASYQLALVPIPLSATNLETIEWKSSNPQVATIDGLRGYITANAKGQSVITARLVQNIPNEPVTEKVITCTVNVSENIIPLTGVSINNATYAAKIGQQITLSLSKRPLNANNGVTEVAWSSDAPQIASVNAKTGEVRALAGGVAKITGTMGAHSASCIVTVKENSTIEVESLDIEASTYKLENFGQTKQLKLTTKPQSAASNAWWTSSNDTIVSVSHEGVVTAKGAGTATITARIGNKTASCQVQVVIKNGWHSINQVSYYYYNGKLMKNHWVKETNGTWRYANKDGKMSKGWLSISGKWYYFENNGIMKTGWLLDGKAWYYLDDSGAMKTGWLKLANKWYYMDKSGVMKTGWLKIGSTWYYLQKSGVMKTGWLKDQNKWYYFDKSGVMKANSWLNDSGTWYYLSASGQMATSRWIGNYYVHANGKMATSQWIGRYYVDKSGRWTKTK